MILKDTVLNIAGLPAHVGDVVIACPERNVQGGFTHAILVGWVDIGTNPQDVYYMPVLRFFNNETKPLVNEKRFNGVKVNYRTV